MDMREQNNHDSQEHQHSQEVENTTEREEHQLNQPTSYTRQEKRQKRFIPFVASSLTGAILGGGIVLYGSPLLGINEPVSIPSSTVEERPSNDSLPIQQTSMNSSDLVKMIEEVSPSVVSVTKFEQRSNPFSSNTQEAEGGTGSGVVFKKDGKDAYIVTNNHVIEGASKINVTMSTGETVDAEVVGADALTDLAVLKIDSQYVQKVAEFGDSSRIVQGEPAIAIGNPLGEQFSRTVTQGIISGTERSIAINTQEGEWELDVLQTDAAINPGNSGGALVNAAGQVIGINSLKIAQSGVEGLGFAIPSNDVSKIVDDLMKNGKVQRAYMGVSMVDITQVSPQAQQEELKLPKQFDKGVALASVEPFSPAADAGLQSKDVIVAINGQDVATGKELRKYLYTKTKIGDKVEVTYHRGAQKKTTSLTLTERGLNNE
ncbi:S1C family serine protease [Metabacillus iocasae]|uniref:Serine protease Do n=1 Tax=Priestia iocasae TaxID=2291674 RepID=A0ABS2QRU2_9BACI|nr:trypsin-like peptidase domain-containing protein [Metabacillus iocasae]MBM7702176.1 serine protease Do [Metabacillus iocasae]